RRVAADATKLLTHVRSELRPVAVRVDDGMAQARTKLPGLGLAVGQHGVSSVTRLGVDVDDTATRMAGGGAAPTTGGRAGGVALDLFSDPAEAAVVGRDTLLDVSSLQLRDVVGSKALEGIVGGVRHFSAPG